MMKSTIPNGSSKPATRAMAKCRMEYVLQPTSCRLKSQVSLMARTATTQQAPAVSSEQDARTIRVTRRPGDGARAAQTPTAPATAATAPDQIPVEYLDQSSSWS